MQLRFNIKDSRCGNPVVAIHGRNTQLTVYVVETIVKYLCKDKKTKQPGIIVNSSFW